MTIRGIHHITLVSGDIRRTAAFYTRALGLRLVKRTVNFDDPGSYHLYFGDEIGRPATLVTFFDWPQLPPGQWGIGATHHFALCVESEEAQLKWKRWLVEQGCDVTGPFDRVYFKSIYFQDPDGTIVEIATRGPGWTIDEAPDALGAEMRPPPRELTVGHRDEAAIAATTWPDPVSAIDQDMALHGLHHITAIGSDIERTTQFYVDLLGMRLVKRTLNFDNPNSPHYYYGVGEGQPGTLITYFAYPHGSMREARIGVGQTHHFALAVDDAATQLAWRERLLGAGVPVTPVLDRVYFKSIYFHDPDGHIVEIATNGPGFLIDEDAGHLGSTLQLPTWLEPRRDEIAQSLPPLD